jgi:adenylate kinase
MPYDTSTSKIVKRLHEHETKTVPVIAKYNERHGVIKIDGLGTFDEVFARLAAGIEDGVKNRR